MGFCKRCTCEIERRWDRCRLGRQTEINKITHSTHGGIIRQEGLGETEGGRCAHAWKVKYVYINKGLNSERRPQTKFEVQQHKEVQIVACCDCIYRMWAHESYFLPTNINAAIKRYNDIATSMAIATPIKQARQWAEGRCRNFFAQTNKNNNTNRKKSCKLKWLSGAWHLSSHRYTYLYTGICF